MDIMQDLYQLYNFTRTCTCYKHTSSVVKLSWLECFLQNWAKPVFF